MGLPEAEGRQPAGNGQSAPAPETRLCCACCLLGLGQQVPAAGQHGLQGSDLHSRGGIGGAFDAPPESGRRAPPPVWPHSPAAAAAAAAVVVPRLCLQVLVPLLGRGKLCRPALLGGQLPGPPLRLRQRLDHLPLGRPGRL